MQVRTIADRESATRAAADCLARWLTEPNLRNVMVAGGNTPLELYRTIAARKLALAHLNIYALDEYVGVPEADPRTCANLLRRDVAQAWGVPRAQFHALTSDANSAAEAVAAYERLIFQEGGLDLVILGLGQNGHVGFNEPGSAVDSRGRVLDLDPTSVAANREWFGGQYAPAHGVTVGLATILGAKRILLLAFGSHKAAAVQQMLHEPPRIKCPASWLQRHPDTTIILDAAAAGKAAGK